MIKIILLAVAALVFAVGAAVAYGPYRWGNRTKELRAKLETVRIPIRPPTYDEKEIENLPPPVRRYFRTALTDGQPVVSEARLKHEGKFNSGETKPNWNRFTSSQIAVMRRPGFDWDARIAVAPGLSVFVHDAYVAGEGALRAEFLGLVTLADVRGTREAAQGELMRFLAEAAWYPTALLPSQGVHWEAVDDDSAMATFTDAETKVSLEFTFDAEGCIRRVRAAARPRAVKGALVATPWEGRFWNYVVRDGMRIPLEGEAAWVLPGGLWPYWRGRATEIAYDFATAQTAA